MDAHDRNSLLELEELAAHAGLPVSVARYFRDRFILFVPTVRVGRTILHPPEAVGVLHTIRELAGAGNDAEAIESALDELYPISVVTAQQIEPAGLPSGYAAALHAVASAFDARGAGFEAEIARLREQLESLASNSALTDIVRLHPALEAVVNDLGDLGHVTATIDGLHTQLAQLASREQLEWIGDVVAAAALRPPQAVMDAAIERRLGELQAELQRTQRHDESATRAALDRLTEELAQQLSRRDQDVQRAFQTLVAAFREEAIAIQAGMAELTRSMSVIAATAASSALHSTGSCPDVGWSARDEWDTARQVSRAHQGPATERIRAPRRLGQPLKPLGVPHTNDALAEGMA